MSGARLESIRLEYGRHSGRFDLPDEGRPVVIAGRNGTGKTTLLEAFLRGLYGFSRRKPEERQRLQLRRPWSGRPMETEVCVRAPDGARYLVRRDFDTDEVVARDETTGHELFRGDGNPAGVRTESRRYQELVQEWVGFAALEPYRGTAWIAQGELVDTRLDDELLRAAAGTHRKVEAARKELRESFEQLTREPLELGGRRKNRSRDLENTRAAADAAVSRLELARTARERRRPLLERSDDLGRDIEAIEAEIRLLEAAYRPITERRTLLAEQKEAEAHLTAVTECIRWSRETEADLARAEAAEASALVGGSYPADFEARLGQAVVLWDRLEEITAVGAEDAVAHRGMSGIGVAVAGLVLVAAGGAIAFGLSGTVGTVIAIVGAVLLGSGLWVARTERSREARAVARLRQTRDELGSIRSRLDSIGADVPGPDLSPASAPEHRSRFGQQREARDAARRARDRTREATERAARLLQGTELGHSLGRDQAIQRLEALQEESRTALARVQLRLEEQPAVPELPDGVEPTVSAVEAARVDRRDLRDSLRERAARLELELRDLERTSEDVFTLERELERLGVATGEIESEVSVRRFAWELVRDAYEAFRSTDQDRLVSAINRRLAELSGGRLGPVEADGDLETARIGIEGRSVPLESPPLSYGEKHAALLAIRLGAADFLAGEGAKHPLLVDEPFTHLDEVRSAQVWDLLRRIAADRQVIITTQDRLVLNHLGVEPDFELAEPERPEAIEALPDRAEAASAGEAGELPTEAAPQPSDVAPGPAQAQLELG